MSDLAENDRVPFELKEIARHSPSEGARNREGWGMIYQRHESYHESETTQVSMQGIVHTADGRKIELSVGLSMSREFMSQNNLSVRAGDALKDPLVINFNGSAAQLTETIFRFDLDADGKAEHIAFVSPDSGFLALDRNGDGKINDGRELFGALSGDGFADLSIADDDGNNWIDESDAIFGRLLIWSRDAEGQETFSTLAERGVGAIYLGSIESPFHLKDSSNALQGIIRSSGLYLHEDGTAGTLQQLDLVV